MAECEWLDNCHEEAVWRAFDPAFPELKNGTLTCEQHHNDALAIFGHPNLYLLEDGIRDVQSFKVRCVLELPIDVWVVAADKAQALLLARHEVETDAVEEVALNCGYEVDEKMVKAVKVWN